MIIDTLEHFDRYFTTEAWRQAGAFLRSLNAQSPEGETQLLGERLIARVQAYDTREPEGGVLESHRRYVDVQATLAGAEAIHWYPQASLRARTPYDVQRDVFFYDLPDGPPPARVEGLPGRWVLLFPEDAHMAQMIVGPAAGPVRKVVLKIERELLLPI